jgi:hypothetical protein
MVCGRQVAFLRNFLWLVGFDLRFGIEPGAGQGLKAFVSIIFLFSLARCLICLLACEKVHEYALHLRSAFVYDVGLVPS